MFNPSSIVHLGNSLSLIQNEKKIKNIAFLLMKNDDYVIIKIFHPLW